MSAMGGTTDVQGGPGAATADAPQSEPAPQAVQTVKEVRVAMALNGGVSLAVWMGGCAVELDAARRAHLGREDLRTAEKRTEDERKGVPPAPGDERTIYHALCEAFGCQLVIDLMSGSSAGGINGALLAAAIDGKRRLHPDYIREKWVGIGDLESLLHPLNTRSPTSLMGGHTFFKKLRRTFQDLLPDKIDALPEHEDDDDDEDEEEQPSKTAEALLALPDPSVELSREVKLDVTATDVVGKEMWFRDTWGEKLTATEYRQRFEFRRTEHYTPQRLSMAARASASFPLAFEPWAVDGRMLNLSQGWRWLIDGGLLDNAPIRAVLNLIPTRSAELPVRRFLCYVNADPPLERTFDVNAELDEPNAPASYVAGGKRGAAKDEPATRPQLQDVVGYVIALPRKATFVDQLRDIQRAAGRSRTLESGEQTLLALDWACLESTAEALLDAYRSRRRIAALEELLDQPADVALAAERIKESGDELPWIPSTIDVPPRSSENGGGPETHWGWGARAAERVLYLALDLIRRRLEDGADQAAAAALTEARGKIYDGVEQLEAIHHEVAGDQRVKDMIAALARDDGRGAASTLCALACLMREPKRDPAIREIVFAAAGDLFAARAHLDTDGKQTMARALFGPAGDVDAAPFGGEAFTAFLKRTLWIEVVRRAYTADSIVETEQKLDFAQITPCAPTLIWTSRPLHPGDEVPDKPREKLTGARYGHFAAFYRSSWRANDFMWGRLDAAVRVVDMLLPAQAESAWPPTPDPRVAAEILATAILPDEAFKEDSTQPQQLDAHGAERRWLVEETLADAMPDFVERRRLEKDSPETAAAYAADNGRAWLRGQLVDCIESDLKGLGQPEVTRALCVRAAQWEILRRELPHVVATSSKDRAFGTAIRALDVIPAKDQTWRDAIETLRQETTPLPERLGVDDKAESASALFIRTASHGGLVGLSALRGTPLPGAPALMLPRALLLPIAGMVARKWWPYAAAVALAFWSFALLITARLITMDTTKGVTWDLTQWLAVGVTLIAAGGAATVCLVPFWRAIRRATWTGKVPEALWLLALAAAGGGTAVVLALTKGVELADVLVQTGANVPWEWASGLAVVALGSFRFVPFALPGLVRRWTLKVLEAPWKGAVSLVVFLVPWLILAAWAITDVVWDAAWNDGGSRSAWAARVALIAPGLLVIAYTLFSVQRRASRAVSAVAARRARRAARGRTGSATT
jgi:patatin-related protein